MKHLLFLLVTVISACSINTTCMSKDAFIKNYNSFINEVKEGYKDIPADSWTTNDKKYQTYVDQCYTKFKAEMSVSERVEFLKQTLSYKVYRSYNDGEYKDNTTLSLQQELEDLGDIGRAELERFIKREIKPNLETAIDEIVNEVEKIGEQLKDWLNKQ